MFDFGKIAETVGSLIGGSATEQLQNGLLDQLSQLGLDPSMLEGLDAQQIVELLGQHGIDLSAFDPSQISDLTSQLGNGGEIASGISQWLGQIRS